MVLVKNAQESTKYTDRIFDRFDEHRCRVSEFTVNEQQNGWRGRFVTILTWTVSKSWPEGSTLVKNESDSVGI